VDGYYFDSSGLVKRYAQETGTGWVRGVTDPAAANEVFLVRISGAEVVSALVRHDPPLAGPALTQALGDFKGDFQSQYQLREVTTNLVVEAMRLAETRRLRGYDAVQLAAALEVQDEYTSNGLNMIFVSADKQLNAAAVAEGLTVDDPNLHP
jgi:predicted nucleic acid-binding protein